MNEPRKSQEPRRDLFEQWAPEYDRSVQDIDESEQFPFAGYEAVLAGICHEAELTSDMAVLDLGTGTGNLASRIQSFDCRVWGTDFSATMLEEARGKLPEVTLVEADLKSTWPSIIDGPFDRIVSAYVLHEFDMPTKMSILQQAADRLSPGGKIAIGDIAFSTQTLMKERQQQWHDRWDHEEYYWVADVALEAAKQAGLHGRWIQVSKCAGIFIFQP